MTLSELGQCVGVVLVLQPVRSRVVRRLPTAGAALDFFLATWSCPRLYRAHHWCLSATRGQFPDGVAEI